MRKSSAEAARFRETSRKISLVAVIACAGQSPSCPFLGGKAAAPTMTRRGG
jgi:hypothetical protein